MTFDSSDLSATHYSRDEIINGLANLSDANAGRIEIASQYFAHRSGIPAEDLRQAAYLRLLEHSCQREYSIHSAVCGMIRSIATSKDSAAHTRQTTAGDTLLKTVNEAMWSTPAPTPEDVLINKQDTELAEKKLQRILAKLRRKLRGKPKLISILEGQLAGLRGKQLLEYTKLTQTDLETGQRSLRREYQTLRIVDND